MASIKTLFDEITIIRPEKVGLLGLDGLEKELNTNVQALAEKIWELLPLSKEFSMPKIIDAWQLPTCPYSTEDVLTAHLETINESINNVSILLDAIQAHAKANQPKLKKSSKMPSAFRNTKVDSELGEVEMLVSEETGKSNIEESCEAMGIPCSISNLIQYGEGLFFAYKNAAAMLEDFVKRTASMLMTEEEIKELTNYNEFNGGFLPSIYKDVNDLRILCNKLINQGFLDINTPIEDFVYFFSGIGDVPKKNLIWVGSNVSLAIFLDSYFININTDIPSKWKLAQKIFKKANLRQSLNNARDNTRQSVVDEQYHIFTDMINL